MGGKYEIFAKYYDHRLDACGLEDCFHDFTNDENELKEWYKYCCSKHYQVIKITIREEE